MTRYMIERLELPTDRVPALRRHYYQTYGTTLRGLQIHHHVDVDDYLAYVHDLPLDRYLVPDPELGSMLQSLPQDKWIFTNADVDHARRVLKTLDVSAYFCGIVDVRAMEFHSKPEIQAYQIALDVAGEHDPENCVYVDDSPTNLAPAHSMGFTTVLVGGTGSHPAADKSIAHLRKLDEVMPELWSVCASKQE